MLAASFVSAIDISERVPPVSAKAVAAPVAVKAAPGELVRAYAAFLGGACGAGLSVAFLSASCLCRQALTRVSLMVAVLPPHAHLTIALTAMAVVLRRQRRHLQER